jgi:hypothetical protein
VPVGPTFAERPAFAHLRKRVRLGGEQAYKALNPLVPLRPVRDDSGRPSATLRRALARADAVVAAGGGYLCDPFWWHGLGVLTTLHAAQRRGLPTAMFGQGIGPVSNPALRRFAGRVMRRLDVLTLREGVYGGPFLRDVGVLPAGTPDLTVGRTDARAGVWLTGDDALVAQVTATDVRSEDRPYLGVNVRISNYSGVGDDIGPQFAEAMWTAAAERATGLLALPVSNFAEDADLPAIERALSHSPRLGVPFVGERLTAPDDLIRATARCRAVVTGSYHAAVFALAQGVPVVGLSASDYYDVKFNGLRNLYPQLIETVRLDADGLTGRIRQAVARAWEIAEDRRRAARSQTLALVQAADEAFDAFAERVGGHIREGASL